MNAIECEIRTRLASLTPLSLDILDESAAHAGHTGSRGGGHYRLHIISTHFSGMNTLARHRAVYTALGNLMQARIHALTITTQTPEEASL